MSHDLVVLAFRGVQRLIVESSSTSDSRAASEIVTRLVLAAADQAENAGSRLVFPALDGVRDEYSDRGAPDGVPNRVVALAPAGTGEHVARDAHDRACRLWHTFVLDTIGESAEATTATPGMPTVHWACVPASEVSNYAEQWDTAQRLLAARRSIHDFEAPERPTWNGTDSCTLSPRWPAIHPPPRAREHERRKKLCTTNWVKHLWRRTQAVTGFPSTMSIASLPYRRGVLEHWDGEVRRLVGNLSDAVHRLGVPQQPEPMLGLQAPIDDQEARWLAEYAGPWIYEDRWRSAYLAREYGLTEHEARQAVNAGRDAVRRLHERLAGRLGYVAPASYLSVLVQDLDDLGEHLASPARGHPDPEQHSETSRVLRTLAERQREKLTSTDIGGVPVYAGGDDLLALVPARSALTAADRCRRSIPDDLPTTASTAVLYFHHSFSLRHALESARSMLAQAKESGGKWSFAPKDACGVGFVRRSGGSDFTVQPWRNLSIGDRFAPFLRGPGTSLSPRLAMELDRDAEELGDLSVRARDRYRAELNRLVGRHLSGNATQEYTAAFARELVALGESEGRADRSAAGNGPVRPEHAARVGIFLRQEAL